MNVVLVSPYRGAIFEYSGVKIQPLGVSYIGAALKKAGHNIQIELLENSDSLPDFDGADVVGISCNAVQFKSGLRVAKSAKEQGKIVIMGGPHPTSSPDEALKSGVVDYVVRAEGEATAVELLEGLKYGKHFNPKKVLGISYIDKGTDSIVHNPNRPYIENLDEVPFPIREANWRYGKSNSFAKNNGIIEYPLITTRGCPYGCNFCDVHLLAGKRFRARTIDNTVKEIEEIITKYNVDRVLIVDDIINYDSKRLMMLFEELIKRGLPVVRWVMGRSDHLIKEPKTVEIMGKAGVRQMFLGIESPNERILKAYKKGGKISLDYSIKAVDLLKQNNIETWGAFLMGEPTETEEDIKRTIDFAKYLNPGIAQFSILTPYPGTELWSDVESKIFTKDWDKYDAMHSVFKTNYVEPEKLEQLLKKAYVSFYTQPSKILRKIFEKDHYGRPDLKRTIEIIKSLKFIFKKNI
jgi:anaerobic magnesium-protoporphyrin IX monomethyl ester cyclase